MKILLTGAYKYSNEQINLIESLGFEIFYHQDERESVSDCASYDAVICNGLFLYNDISKFENLKYIQLTSAGLDRVPTDYIEKKDIKIFNARGVYSVPMAEFALCSVLNLYKKSRFFMENQKAHKWEKNRDLMELLEKKVLIVGCGSVGDECAKRFLAFGCTVSGVDAFLTEKPFYERIYPLAELDNCLKESDIVVLTLPLTEETKHLINSERLKNFKKNSVLVNIARGAIVDTDALLSALNTTLSGALIDVFEEEPLDAASELWDMENVILTPHNSFVGEKNSERLFDVILKNLKGWLE